MVELLPIVKKIAIAVGAEDYNVLQVRSRLPRRRLEGYAGMCADTELMGAEQRKGRAPAGRCESPWLRGGVLRTANSALTLPRLSRLALPSHHSTSISTVRSSFLQPSALY